MNAELELEEANKRIKKMEIEILNYKWKENLKLRDEEIKKWEEKSIDINNQLEDLFNKKEPL